MCRLVEGANRRKAIYCGLIYGFLILMVGLRHHTMGVDLAGYLKSYDRLHQMSWKEVLGLESYLNYEKGYIIFNKIIAFFTFGNKQIFLLSCTFLTVFPVAYIIYKKSDDVLLSTVIYLGLPVFLLCFSGLRQSIALGICFYALKFVEHKKFWHFLICVLFASFFHYTAMVFLAVYFFYHLQIPGKVRVIFLALFPIVFLFRKQLFTLLSLLFKKNAILTSTGAYTLMIIFIMIYVFLLIFFYGDKDPKVNGYMNVFFMACLSQIFSTVYDTAIRVGYYFMFSLVLLLPMALMRLKDRRYAILIRYAVILCFVIFFFDSALDSSWARAYPYYFFWQTIPY